MDRERKGAYDLESLEEATREVMLGCGAIILEGLLAYEDGVSLEKKCECKGKFVNHKRQLKTIRTVLGPVRLWRKIQRCNGCHSWRVPVDIVLDVVRTGFSPGLRRIMAKTGALVCFDRARDLIYDLAGIRVTDKDVERIAEAIGADMAQKERQEIEAAMAGVPEESTESPETLYIATDGTGIPVLRKETDGRRGKATDGIARSREVKLGAIFTQTSLDDKTKPLRDPFSTTYVGQIESVDSFGPRLYTEALRRGVHSAKRVVVIGDGAPWIWNLADEHFPDAIQIVDYYHAQEHLGDLGNCLFYD